MIVGVEGLTSDGTLRDSEYTSPDGSVNNIGEASSKGDVPSFSTSYDNFMLSVSDHSSTAFQNLAKPVLCFFSGCFLLFFGTIYLLKIPPFPYFFHFLDDFTWF